MLTLNSDNKINLLSKWIKTVDLVNLFAISALLFIGLLTVLAASPTVAESRSFDRFHFVLKHTFFLCPTLLMLIIISLFSSTGIKRISLLGFVITFILLVLVIFFGKEINGAKRWIYIYGFSIQPSEFIKPFLVVVSAILFTKNTKEKLFFLGGESLSVLLITLVMVLLILQPDFGMMLSIFLVWSAQYFVAGLKLRWITLLMMIMTFIGIAGYSFFTHVRLRIDSFLSSGINGEQVNGALKAYQSGGILGKGPGEGIVKNSIPEAHTDFIFPVIAEEYGLIACLSIVMLIATIILRGFNQTAKSSDIFAIVAAAGLLMQFGLQALINISVTVNIIPTTGMTLPFISYGGSSMLAMGLAMGMMLALTKRSYGGSVKL